MRLLVGEFIFQLVAQGCDTIAGQKPVKASLAVYLMAYGILFMDTQQSVQIFHFIQHIEMLEARSPHGGKRSIRSGKTIGFNGQLGQRPF